MDRLVPKPMAADPTQRVGDNAFHLPGFLIQNLSREDPRVENLHITTGHDFARTIVLTVTLPLSRAKGGVTTRRMCAVGRQDTPNLPPLASTACRQSCKTDRGATDSISLLHFNCRARRCVGGTVSDTESNRFTYSARAGAIERDRKGWLQQTPSHSRNRIC